MPPPFPRTAPANGAAKMMDSSSALRAWETAQASTAEAQQSFQNALAESHAAYLRFAETTLATLGALTHGQAPRASEPHLLPEPTRMGSDPEMRSAEPGFEAVPISGWVAPTRAAAVENSVGFRAEADDGPAPFAPMAHQTNGAGAEVHVAPPAGPAPIQTLPPPEPPVPPSIDLDAQLRAVIAEATGYPQEVLQPSMSLEADLGIDSIKRVEILSMVKKAVPHLPELDAATLGSLETLGEVADHLKAALGPAGTAEANLHDIPSNDPAPDIDGKLLSVVSEATGYPPEVLQPEMSLEADLGIDSIKRVEILSMVKKVVPELPELDAATLGSLETLGEVAAHLSAALGVNQGRAASPGPAAVDLEAQLRAVVSEATGYPEEVLQPEMSLEADLGIDSIKRVEILSMVKKAVPQLPELDAATLGSLETLGEVADHLAAALAEHATGPGERSKSGANSSTSTASSTPAQATVPAPELTSSREDQAYRFRPRRVRAPATGLARIRPDELRSVAVVGGPPEVAQAVTQALGKAGISARSGDAALESDDGLVLLHGLRSTDKASDSLDILRSAFAALRTAKGVLQASEASPSLLVSVQETGGGLGLENPPPAARAPVAGLAALMKTAALEAAGTVAFSMDVSSGLTPEEIAQLIVDELLAGGLEREVAFDAAGTRYSVCTEAEPTALGGDLPFEKGDVVVVSGGARGVTAECLKALAAEVPLRFLLLGRTELAPEPPEAKGVEGQTALRGALLQAAQARGEPASPAEVGRAVKQILAVREVRASIAALEAAGSEAKYLSLDITDRYAVGRALDALRKTWGPASGVIHAAGVIQDKRILEKTDEQLQAVLSTKLDGLYALMAATESDPLKGIVLFSSVAAHGGNVGQADYAMANAALDAFAAGEAARRPHCRVKSLAWGPWRGGMVSTALEAHFEAAGVSLIELAEGARWMVEDLKSPEGVRVVLGRGALGPGSLAGVGLKSAPARLSVRVDRDRYPELVDHAVEGPPVVPLVLAVEWMLRALSGIFVGSPVLVLEDLRVRRGLAVESWPEGHLDLSVLATPNAGGLDLALVDADGNARYSAQGFALHKMPEEGPPCPSGIPQAEAPQPYGGVLFHGPKFQALAPLKNLGDEGASALLTDASSLGWSLQHRRSDPVRLDGALQLAVLVTERVIGGASLPTRVGRIVTNLDAQAGGPGEAWSVTREKSTDQVLHDALVKDGAGQTAAILNRLETTRRPGWKPNP